MGVIQKRLTNLFRGILWSVFALMLISCNTIHPVHRTSAQDINGTLQQSIVNNKCMFSKPARLSDNLNAALLPPLSHYVNPTRNVEPRFDVAANKIPARDFFVGLVSGTSYNMVVHPNINGVISLNLKNVTIHEAMEAVRDTYGYEYHRTSYGYEVLPPTLETQIFHINYLDVQRTGKSYIQLTTGQVSNVGTINIGGGSNGTNNNTPITSAPGVPVGGTGTISSIETKSEMEFWKDMDKSIRGMITNDEHHSVTVNAQSGVIAVHAFPAELHMVSRFIESLQTSLTRQVILEAKILEIQLDDQYQAGIDWSILGNPSKINAVTGLASGSAGIGQDGTDAVTGTDLKALNGIFAIRFNGNFKLLIQLLQTQGNVQVLSSPHISTVNNQKAVIKVGQDEFFVTGVSTTNTIIGTNTLPSQDVSLTPFFSGITLDVTPEISSEDAVILHIHPSVSKVSEQTKIIGLGSSATGTPNNLTLPLAFSTIRESDNIVHAKNGQVVVIGGLMQNTMAETLASTPWLSKIPFIGAAFRRTEQQSTKSELVILLRPIVANNKTMTRSLEEEQKSFRILHRPFHTGGLPKIFGNEAEREDNE